jgi:RimJ/RimL family protein N-acetyltransferase
VLQPGRDRLKSAAGGEAHYRECEVFKGEWADSFVYAMLAEEYRQLK